MKHVARRIGRSLAFVLPVVLVLSGSLAVTQVPWANDSSTSQVVNAATEQKAPQRTAPHEQLRQRLVAELRRTDPGVALTQLQREVDRKPSLARHCADLARSLGKAAVRTYGALTAQSYSRPVCDSSFALGVADSPQR
ncbi:hypothetical protein [Streptomyces sp. NPDC005438]|uniref:hypothetical protein n=1 Tax=Streptomyces sp. NPDC005438 TaxID=3156880 RepID=UPI0033A12CC6